MSILCFGLLGPGTIPVKNIYCFFMHIKGGGLYGVNITSQHEYCCLELPNGLKPSVHNPSLTFLVSLAKFGWHALNVNQISLFEEWHISPSSEWCFTCYLMLLAVVAEADNRCSLGPRGEWWNYFLGVLYFIHLETPQSSHCVILAVGPQQIIHLLIQQSIFSTSNPRAEIFFLRIIKAGCHPIIFLQQLNNQFKNFHYKVSRECEIPFSDSSSFLLPTFKYKFHNQVTKISWPLLPFQRTVLIEDSGLIQYVRASVVH